MRGVFAVMMVVCGLYGIGFLQALEATDDIKSTMAEKSFEDANTLLAKYENKLERR